MTKLRAREILSPAVIVVVLAAAIIEAGVYRREACYGDLGCFQPIATKVPASPESINASFLLATRDNNKTLEILASPGPDEWSEKIGNSSFDAQKETKFLVHGFNARADSPTYLGIKDNLLTKGDFNVFLVQWKHGAATIDYDQAASNSLLVAAQVAKFINWLRTSHGLDPAKVHLIGHSLGAHICGNAGSRVQGLARVTGLDPAAPRFVDFDIAMRLDSTDAHFVDVIHTDGEAFTVSKGYGMAKAIGHIDFYPNGGSDQPGCTDDELAGILGLLGGNPDNSVSCSHTRAESYFKESINSVCKFLARPCANWTTYDQNGCSGCPQDGCPIMGFDADKTSARGIFYLSTAQTSPYCGSEYFVEMDLSDEVVDSRGRIYITLLGDINSTEVEFTRDFRQYHANDKEKHVIAVSQDVGALTGIRVKFVREKKLGQQPQGHDNHVTIHRIIVEDRTTQTKTIFCTRDVAESDLHAVTIRTDSSCS